MTDTCLTAQVLEVVAEEEAEGLSYLDLLTAHPSERGSDGAESPETDQADTSLKATQKQVRHCFTISSCHNDFTENQS